MGPLVESFILADLADFGYLPTHDWILAAVRTIQRRNLPRICADERGLLFTIGGG
jgi:hypothetical protein